VPTNEILLGLNRLDLEIRSRLQDLLSKDGRKRSGIAGSAYEQSSAVSPLHRHVHCGTNRFPQIAIGCVSDDTDDFHGRHLGKRDITSGWNGTEGIFHAVDLLFPDGFSKPDGKPVHLQATPAGGQEVPQLMDKYEQIEEHQNFQKNNSRF